MDSQWEISIGNGVVTTNRICKVCTIKLYNRKLVVDMIVLNTRGYDVILGMTWLSRYHRVIDCQNKKMIFRMSYQLELQFIGERKSAREKNQLDCTIAEVKKKGMPVLNEFSDVSEEMSGLSLDRAIEFSIDIIPRTPPISKASYRMAPTELEILKKQLQEYSEKSLIRPRTSHSVSYTHLTLPTKRIV